MKINSLANFIFIAVWGFLFFLSAGCTNDTANTKTVSLPEVACRPEDVAANPPFTIAQTHTAVPPNTPLADQIEQYYGVDLIENRLANMAAFCHLYLLVDETAAADLLAHFCQNGVTPAEAKEPVEPPQAGESACAFQSEGFREVHFQQGRLVVSIWGDSGGWGVDEWAVAVNGRLL